MSYVRNMRAHHVHAVEEDDLPQSLPAHDAEIFIIMNRLLTVCFGGLQTRARIWTHFAGLSASIL